MLHCTCTIQHVTSLRYIFCSFSLPLVVFLLFLPLFSLVVGYIFLVCFFLSWFMFLDLSYNGCRVHYLIIGQNYFVLGEGRPYLKASANSNVYSTCVLFNKKKNLLPSPLLSSLV